jgi:hypothetical protein
LATSHKDRPFVYLTHGKKNNFQKESGANEKPEPVDLQRVIRHIPDRVARV